LSGNGGQVVIPAKAGIQLNDTLSAWIPAFAGMTEGSWIMDKCSILVTLFTVHTFFNEPYND
jgi:hypothetical protein